MFEERALVRQNTAGRTTIVKGADSKSQEVEDYLAQDDEDEMKLWQSKRV